MSTSRGKWSNHAEERRLRCQLTERRITRQGTKEVQCTEDRRTEHVHQWRGVPFQRLELA